MAAPSYLTKGELRDKLLIRLGYGGLGAAAGMFVPMADDLLEEAQEQLFQVFTDEKGVRDFEFTTGLNQRWYDIPTACDIDRILGAWSKWGTSDQWIPLTRGISPRHDGFYDTITSWPERYDIRFNPDTNRTQIEVWPEPDGVYDMKLEGPMVLLPFVQDSDRASFDSRLVLLYAVAYGKAHLNKKDAKSAMDAWLLRLSHIRANQHGDRRYIRRNPSKPERSIRRPPKVV